MFDPDSELDLEDLQEAARWLQDHQDDPVLRAFILVEQSQREINRALRQCAWAQDLRARNATRRLFERSGVAER